LKVLNKEGLAPGMGVRFDSLPIESQETLEQILTQKQHAMEFSDQPTRVAPGSGLHEFIGLEERPASPPKAEGSSPPIEPQPTAEGDSLPTSQEANKELEATFPESAFSEQTSISLTKSDEGKNLSALEQSASSKDEPISPAPISSPSLSINKESDSNKVDSGLKSFAKAKGSTGESGPLRAPSPTESDEARKERLAKILFSMEEPEGGGNKASALASGEKDKGEEQNESADWPAFSNEPAPPKPEPKSSSGLWWIIIILILAGIAFAAYKFLVKDPSSLDKAGGEGSRVMEERTSPVPHSPKPQPTMVNMTKMRVESNPSGAKILLDGKETGKVTPAMLEDLIADKPVQIRLDLPGKKLYTVTLKPDPDKPLVVDLKKASERRIQLVSEPPGAIVVINGIRIGKTPMDYKRKIDPQRPLSILFLQPGFQELRKDLLVNQQQWLREGDDEVLTVSVTLEKKEGTPPPVAPLVKKGKAKVKPRLEQKAAAGMKEQNEETSQAVTSSKISDHESPKVEQVDKVESKPETDSSAEESESKNDKVKKPSWTEE
jgi:hypothetical protein